MTWTESSAWNIGVQWRSIASSVHRELILKIRRSALPACSTYCNKDDSRQSSPSKLSRTGHKIRAGVISKYYRHIAIDTTWKKKKESDSKNFRVGCVREMHYYFESCFVQDSTLAEMRPTIPNHFSSSCIDTNKIKLSKTLSIFLPPSTLVHGSW